jgi:hypothetical protein
VFSSLPLSPAVLCLPQSIPAIQECHFPFYLNISTTQQTSRARGRPGSKWHVVTDARCAPLAIALTGAHAHDSEVFEALIDSISPVKGKRGRPRRAGPKSRTPTKPTTTRAAGVSCESGAPRRGWPDEESRAARG